MKKQSIFNLLKEKIRNHRIISILILMLLVLGLLFSIGFLFSNFWQNSLEQRSDSTEEQLKSLISGFSKLDYDSRVKDSYSLKPEKSDTLGVEPDSSFILKSKSPIDLDNLGTVLKVDPQIEMIKQKISEYEVKLNPVAPIENNALVNISLSSGEEGSAYDYSWAYQVKDSFKVVHSIPRDEVTNVPLNSGIEITFSHDNFVDYDKYFEISPHVEGRFEKHERTLVYVPSKPLNSKTVYKISVKTGLPIDGSLEILNTDYQFAFETESDRSFSSSKWRGIYNNMIETTTSHPPIIQIYSEKSPSEVSVELFKFSSWDEYLESLKKRDDLPWWSYSREDYVFNTESLNKVGDVALEKKDSGTRSFSFLSFPDTLSHGFYLAQFSQEDKKMQAWIQVSDISAYYNVTETDTIFWVNSNESNSPEKDALIELVGGSDSFETDKKGIALFETPEEIIKQSDGENRDGKLYFKISKNEDVLIQPVIASSRSYWWSGSPEEDHYWSYLYTDRPRYKTTDKIKIWGMLKPRDKNDIKEKVTVSLYKEGYLDYYYQPIEIKTQELSLSDVGTYQGEIDLKNLNPDYYNLELKIGDKVVKRKYITVKSYTKPAFQLNITPDRKAAFAGEEVLMEVNASFFEGTPVPFLKLKVTTPKGDEYLNTDENGIAKFNYSLDYYDCDKEYGCWPDYEYVTIKPENSELAEITAEASLRIYGPKVYAESEVTYPEEGKAQIEITSKYLDIEKVNDDYTRTRKAGEKKAAGTKVSGEIIKVTYTKKESGTGYDFINKKIYTNYRYEKKEEKIRDFEGETDKNGSFSLEQDLDEETSYKINYKVYDADGRYDVYRDSMYYFNGKNLFEYSSWNYNYYSLALNKEEFSLGEEVVVDLKNNNESLEEEENGYLFLQLKNGLQEYDLSDQSTYKFNFDKSDIPNVNLAGVYFDGVTYFEMGNEYWGNSANFKYDNNELKLKIKTDKDSYEPGQEVNLDVKIEDKDGNPVEAAVNFNLIDEAYYSLFEDTASPLQTIYSSVGLGKLFSGKTHFSLAPVVDMAEKGGCFAAGTPVLMANGNEKNIEDVEKGDKIFTFSDPITRELEEGTVTETWKHTVAEYMIINDTINVTPEHQIFSNGRFTDAGLLKKGDWMLDSNGEKIAIKSISIHHEIINVYNFRVDPQHSFFAGGVYVHNEEKGGGPREFFTDAAVFESIKTNSSGKGTLTFKLPDNITSWRVTSQAISKDIYAGMETIKIPVSLPVFADITIGDEYLVEDKPIVRMRAFGSALNENDDVSFSIDTPSLGSEKGSSASTKAFQPYFYPLPDLSNGKHNITYNLDSFKGSDSVMLPISVMSSRMEKKVSKQEQLTTETKIDSENNFPITVILSDKTKSVLHPILQKLSWQWGDRLDQKYVKMKARNALTDYYNQEERVVNFNPFDYQLTRGGGISLLPYSDEDLELSARISALGAEEFDKNSLTQYFLKKIADKKSTREEISLALFGLAELKEPVLPRIDSWLKRDDLSLKEKIYMAQAIYDLGSTQWSLSLYNEIMQQYAQQKSPHIIVKGSNNADEVFHNTALAAVLASSLGANEDATGMIGYLIMNQKLYGKYKNSENLYNLEELNYSLHSLENSNPEAAKIKFILSGKEEYVELQGNNNYSFQLTSEEAKEISFTQVDGDVGIAMKYLEPFDVNDVERDNDISVRREYYVKGKKTNKFSENDSIEVRLYPIFSDKALKGEYQLTDVLPSGLAPMTKIQTSFSGRGATSRCSYWHPYNIDDQVVKYRINRFWKNNYCGGKNYIYYLARVKNKGTYKAEPATLQSVVNPDFINYSDEKIVEIN